MTSPEPLDPEELPQDRVDELARWLHDHNIGICEMDDTIVYNDLKSMRALAEQLLRLGPDGIRITSPAVPSTGDLREQIAEALSDVNCVKIDGSDRVRRPFAARSPMAYTYADAALSVVAPLLAAKDAEIAAVRANFSHAYAALKVTDDEALGLRARVAELTRERYEALPAVHDDPECRAAFLLLRNLVVERTRERDLYKSNWERAQQANTTLLASLGRPAAQEALAGPALPVEVQRLMRAVERVRDYWPTVDHVARVDLWAAVRYETDLVWASLGAGGLRLTPGCPSEGGGTDG